MNPEPPAQNPVASPTQKTAQPLLQDPFSKPQRNPLISFVFILILVVIIVGFAYQGFLEGLSYIKSNPLSIFAGLLTVIGVTAIFYLSKKTIKVKVAPNSILSNFRLSGDINLAIALILWAFSIVIFVSGYFVNVHLISSSRYDPRIVSGAVLTFIGDYLWFNNAKA